MPINTNAIYNVTKGRLDVDDLNVGSFPSVRSRNDSFYIFLENGKELRDVALKMSSEILLFLLKMLLLLQFLFRNCYFLHY